MDLYSADGFKMYVKTNTLSYYRSISNLFLEEALDSIIKQVHSGADITKIEVEKTDFGDSQEW
jgi:hypothetical protein